MNQSEIKQRFDRLLHAMLTKPPLAEKPKAKGQTSGVARDEGYDETPPPKGTSGDAS